MGPTGSRRPASVWSDSVGLFGVVVGLCLVHFGLPASVHEQLVFRYGDPIALTPWTAVLVHDSIRHLASNLLAYVVVIGPTYALYRTWGRRRRFWLLMGGVIVIVPPLVTAADYWLLYQRWGLAGPQTVGYGFSGVVSGLGGVLCASTVAAVGDWYGQRAALTTAVTVGAAGCGGVLLTSAEIDSGASSLFVGAIAVALLGVFCTRVVSGWYSYYDRERLVLTATCGVIATVLIASLFQGRATVAPRVVDVLAHATGMSAGLSLTVLSSLGGE